MCVYLYIYIHIHLYTYVYACVCVCMHEYTYTFIYIYIYTYICISPCFLGVSSWVWSLFFVIYGRCVNVMVQSISVLRFLISEGLTQAYYRFQAWNAHVRRERPGNWESTSLSSVMILVGRLGRMMFCSRHAVCYRVRRDAHSIARDLSYYYYYYYHYNCYY